MSILIDISLFLFFSFCERRQNAMKEHIYEGFEKNWWTFNNNL